MTVAVRETVLSLWIVEQLLNHISDCTHSPYSEHSTDQLSIFEVQGTNDILFFHVIVITNTTFSTSHHFSVNRELFFYIVLVVKNVDASISSP